MPLKNERTLIFQYKGFDKKNTQAQGEITGISITQARHKLMQQGFSGLKIKKKNVTIFGLFQKFKNRENRKTNKIKSQEITLFTRQMATLVTTGIPLVQALGVVAETSISSVALVTSIPFISSIASAHTTLYSLIQKIKMEVESGVRLSEALKQHPRQFDQLYCSLIETGEHSGTLDNMFDRLATHKEKIDALMRKVKKALYYPIAVFMIAIVVSIILLLKVVPTFEQMFHDLGAELPLFTKLVLQLSNLLQTYGIYLFATVILVFYLLIRKYRKNSAFRYTLQRFALRIPILGSILQKTAIARFSRTLATTTKAGIPLSQALDTVAQASGNIVFISAIQRIKEGLIAGQQMHKMMRETFIFPPLVIQMISIGEESGALEEMLNKVAHLYEDEVDTQIDGLTSLLEPIIMVILGIIVGGLVIAMYLPIFQMGNIL